MTNPPIPPAVVEAVARAIFGHEVLHNGDIEAAWMALMGSRKDRYRGYAQAALSAALATGSVVICSPELRKLREDAQITRLQADPDPKTDGGWRIHDLPDAPNQHGVWFADYLCGGMEEAHAKFIVAAVNAFARAHQEDKG